MDYFQTLERWQQLSAAIKLMTAEERSLREGLFNGTFSSPEEGTNKFVLPDGRVLKAVYRINRTLDNEALEALAAEKGKVTAKTLEAVRKVKYSLNAQGLEGLSDRQRELVLTAITEKPGLPTLEVLAPKATE